MASESPSANRLGWERIWRSGDSPPRYRSFAPPNQSVVEWADTIPKEGFVLDIGCGVGRHCLYLGGRGFRVAGVDISPSGVAISQDACAASQIAFDGRVSDMTTLPWSDTTFDAALSTSTMAHHLRADIQRSLAEVRRVLKPGGSFLVDFPSKARSSYQDLRRDVAAGDMTEPEPDTFVNQRLNLDDRDDSFLPHHFCDEADVRDLLCAFEIVRLWTDLPEGGAATGVGQRIVWIAHARRPLLD